MNTSLATTAIAGPQPGTESNLQASIAESYRCARELDASIVQYRDLLEKVAASPFVAHMRQLASSVAG